ncbi:MAG: Uma2 family endonuclease [Isosphaeraceae bacterium]|nr:Uma2 family endonuclease [Isosphaeraceae bacterium]
MAATTRQAANPPAPPASEASARPLPTLCSGDRLTADEFERRYDAMPHLKKAELIDGVVYVPSPVADDHGTAHFDLITWLGLYRAATPGVVGSDNGTLRLQLDNRPQPDAHLRILESYGGQARLSEDGYVVGAPELVAEVAISSANYDLHDKLDAYLRNGVREYVVWRVQDRAIDWFVLREGRFEPLPPGEDGIYRSEVFPGLWLDPAALIRGDLAAVFAVEQQGIASPEHAAFIARLQAEAAHRQAEGGAQP